MRRHDLSDEQFALPLSGEYNAAPKKRSPPTYLGKPFDGMVHTSERTKIDHE